MNPLIAILAILAFSVVGCSSESEPDLAASKVKATPKTANTEDPKNESEAPGADDSAPEDETAVPPINVEESDEPASDSDASGDVKEEEAIDIGPLQSELNQLRSSEQELKEEVEIIDSNQVKLEAISESIEEAFGAAMEATFENYAESISQDGALSGIEGMEMVMTALRAYDQEAAIDSIAVVLENLANTKEEIEQKLEEIADQIEALEKSIEEAAD